MQVKKFEAKNMKEALELVKVHMGPEAIILSAKDTHRGFGLMGEKSVEVTAAVSDETLRRKKAAEGKLREDLRERFQKIPASKQKEFIEKAFQSNHPNLKELVTAAHEARDRGPAAADVRAQFSGMRYIDIPEEGEAQTTANASAERVKRAAARARAAASSDIFQDAPVRPAARAYSRGSVAPKSNVALPAVIPPPATPVPVALAQTIMPNKEVMALESQVQELKSLVERFQKMPQMPMTMHPGAEQGLSFEMSPAYQKLTAQGINPITVTKLLKRAQAEMDMESLKRSALVEAWVVQQLMNGVDVATDPTAGRYHVFMGTTGQGKTSSMVKFASDLVMKKKRTIAIVSLDTFKVGAADQLRIYAQILNVPFAIVRSPEDWAIAEQKLKGVQHILVDCPGFSLRSMNEVDWLKHMIPPAELGRRIHYVQSILARDEDAMDLAQRYQMLNFDDVVFTRLDESSRHGLMLNFQERFRTPLHSFGTGPVIPEDFEFATKERVIDFLFKLSSK